MMLAVALLWTAVSAAAVAREFRTADTRNEDYRTVQALDRMVAEQSRAGAIDLNRTNVAPIGTMAPSVNVLAMPFPFRSLKHLQNVLDGSISSDRRPFEAAMAGIYAEAERDPAISAPIERIGSME